MEYIRATIKHTEEIYKLVQDSITITYSKYYLKEIVNFFCLLHSRERIQKDIESGCVSILLHNDILLGTGSFTDHHITRVYVSPFFQGKGYGSYIMDRLEEEIALNYDTVDLDASLPACHLYESRGYLTKKHKKFTVDNGVVLAYEIMEKQLPTAATSISYEGKFFVPMANTENGEVDGSTIFSYHQKGNIIWASYKGGEIIKGSLIGTVAQNGELDFYYQHMNGQKQVRIGKCHSIPRILENGSIELSEEWQWLNGDKSKGTSTITEQAAAR